MEHVLQMGACYTTADAAAFLPGAEVSCGKYVVELTHAHASPRAAGADQLLADSCCIYTQQSHKNCKDRYRQPGR